MLYGKASINRESDICSQIALISSYFFVMILIHILKADFKLSYEVVHVYVYPRRYILVCHLDLDSDIIKSETNLHQQTMWLSHESRSDSSERSDM